jgi:hypothetical protein
VAVGQVAVGQVAVGQVAVGQVAVGQVAVGQVACRSSGCRSSDPDPSTFWNELFKHYSHIWLTNFIVINEELVFSNHNLCLKAQFSKCVGIYIFVQ